MRRLLPIFLAIAALPAAGQSVTPYTFYGSDGNLYGTNSSQFYSYSAATATNTVLNSSATGLQLCLEKSDDSFLGLQPGSSGYPQLVSVTMAGQITAIATFPGKSDAPVCPAMANDGSYYGFATAGGAYNKGYLYQLTAAGQVVNRYSFAGKSDGSAPDEVPLQASDGNIYAGGAGLLRYNPATGMAVLPASFSSVNTLFEGPDGNFYQLSNDSVLQITPSGATQTIYTDTGSGEMGNYNGDFEMLPTGSAAYPLALLEGFNYQVLGEYGCIASGNYFPLQSLSLTGSPGPVIFSLGSWNGDDYLADAATYDYSLVYTGNGGFYGSVYYLAQQETITSNEQQTCEESSFSNQDVENDPVNATPMTLSLNKTHVVSKGSATLTWQINDAFSDTAKQCFGYGLLSGPVALTGSATVTAPGSGSYIASIVCGGTQTGVAKLVAGNAALSLSVTPQFYGGLYVDGSTVQFIATISNPGSPAPTGKVNLLYGSTVVASAALVSNTATFNLSTAAVPAGTYSLVANYPGDPNYGAATSSPVSVTLTPRASTTVALSPAAQTVQQGTAAAVAITVKAPNSIYVQEYGYYPTGTVTLSAGTTTIGSAPLSSGGTASFSASTVGVPPGTYPISATYSGDTYNAPSKSAPVNVTISSTSPVSLAISPNPVPTGKSFALTSTVTGKNSPGGTMIFYAGNTQFASATVTNGAASLTAPSGTLASGTYQVTAYYAGDANNPSGTSPAVTLTVQ